ncbi:MAG: ATP-binding protein [Spirochaetia bacterium]|jgi:predicted AAA+ superfamily ATPase|nr:ATP-binding protein [Spirochaetia bacterium]
MAKTGVPISRRITRLAQARTNEEPVILLEGPRSTGKSTALRMLAAEFKTAVIDLDNQIVRDDAFRDPGFYTASDSTVFIDEYQRVPAILDAIKTRMNISSRPAQFVLSGSTRHDALAGSVQALTGRIHRMQIFPFAQSELEGVSPDIISGILADAQALINKAKKMTARETREGYIQRIVRGGFPLAVFRAAQARSRWFDDYVRQTVERDIPDIMKIRNKRGLSALLRKLASQTAQILTLENVSSSVAIDISTARDYIQLLKDVFMVYELPVWGRTLGGRVSAKPKIHILDSGIAARLLGLSAEKLYARQPTALTEFGHLLETFTVSEILKELSWLDDAVLSGHWHTRDNTEVDFVLERLDGSVYGFEIKTAGRASGDVFTGLAALRKFAGSSFQAGFVLYTGPRAFQFDDRLYALPISALWE